MTTPLVELIDEVFLKLCQTNPDIKFESTAQGELIVVPPTGGETGNRNLRLIQRLGNWSDADGTGLAFDSSTLFILPNKARRSPDAAWILLERWKALTPEERETFPPICPEFVVELRATSDRLRSIQDKMQEYLNNGARLGWLINPKDRQAEIYRQGQQKEVLQAPTNLSGEQVLPGFILDLKGIL